MAFWNALGEGLVQGGNSLNQLAQFLIQREEQDLNRRMMGIFPTDAQPMENYRTLSTGTDLGASIPTSPAGLAQQAASGVGLAKGPSPSNVPPTSVRIGLAKGGETGSSGVGLAPGQLAQVSATQAPPPAEFVTKQRPYSDAVDMGGGYTYIPSASMAGQQFARERQARREDAEADAQRALENNMAITEHGFTLEQDAARELREQQNKQAHGVAFSMGWTDEKYNPSIDYAALVQTRTQLETARINASDRGPLPKEPQTLDEYLARYAPQYGQPNVDEFGNYTLPPNDAVDLLLQQWAVMHPNDPDPRLAKFRQQPAPLTQPDTLVDDGNALGDFLGGAKEFAKKVAGGARNTLGFGAPPIDTTMRGDATAPPSPPSGGSGRGKGISELRKEYDEAAQYMRSQGKSEQEITKELGIRP